MTDTSTSRSWIWDDEDSEQKIDGQVAIAKSLDNDPNFFEIDWIEWKLKPTALIVKILALSVGINPAHPCASIEWASTYAQYATGSAAEKLKVFRDRWPVVSRNLSKNGGDIEVIKPGEAWRNSIRLRDFTRLANDAGWDLPAQFPGLSAIADQPNNRNCTNTPASIPGHIGRTAIIKAALEIAWEIEQNTGQIASPKAVREQLKKHSNNGDRFADILHKNESSRELWWRPEKGEPKIWSADACETAISRWIASRNEVANG